MPAPSDNPPDYPFGHHAGDWWDPAGPLRTLHIINPVRLDYIDRHCGLAGKQVLDLGCGGGLLSEAMAGHGAHVTGADSAAELIETAAAHARTTGLDIDYVHADSSELPAAGEARFDIVVCLEMLEHVPDPASVVRACANLVKPGGHVFFSTINRNPKSFMLAIVGAEYVLGLLPRGTHEYARLIRPSELAQWCRDARLEVRDTNGMAYNPVTRVSRLTRSLDINYLLYAKRPHA